MIFSCGAPDVQHVLPAYEKAMLREVERIARAIPPDDLAIQWDVCLEMLAWDGRWPTLTRFPGMEQVFASSFARLGAGVPNDIELASICATATSTRSTSSSRLTRPT